MFTSFVLFACKNGREDTSLPGRQRYPILYRYTYDLDSTRQKLGLPLINGNLKFLNASNNCFTDPPTDCAEFGALDSTKKPRLESKIVFWDSLSISLERNYFVGPNDERLQIFYGYKLFQGWTHLGFGYGLYLPQKGHVDIGKTQADSLLLLWHLMQR